VGKKRSTVTNYMRLLKLPPLIQAGMRDQMIAMGHARALINLDEEKDQLRFYKETIAKDWSVREVEAAVRTFKEGPAPTANDLAANKVALPDAYLKLRDQLKDRFDSKVDINLGNKGRGKIVIPFNSPKDLERIIQIMNQRS
jgi:ParB family chromosome partitioning protein